MKHPEMKELCLSCGLFEDEAEFEGMPEDDIICPCCGSNTIETRAVCSQCAEEPALNSSDDAWCAKCEAKQSAGEAAMDQMHEMFAEVILGHKN